MSAGGAELPEVVVRSPVDLFGREQGPFVFGVSGLSADAALVLALWQWWLGRLDDIGGRRLGRRRRILPRRGELRLELGESRLEGLQLRLLSLQLRLLSLQLRLQPKAIRTMRWGFNSHGDRFYITPE